MTNESGFQGHAMCLRVSSFLRDLVAIFIFFFILSIVTFKKKKMRANHFLSLAICAPFEFIFFQVDSSLLFLCIKINLCAVLTKD